MLIKIINAKVVDKNFIEYAESQAQENRIIFANNNATKQNYPPLGEIEQGIYAVGNLSVNVFEEIMQALALYYHVSNTSILQCGLPLISEVFSTAQTIESLEISQIDSEDYIIKFLIFLEKFVEYYVASKSDAAYAIKHVFDKGLDSISDILHALFLANDQEQSNRRAHIKCFINNHHKIITALKICAQTLAAHIKTNIKYIGNGLDCLTLEWIDSIFSFTEKSMRKTRASLNYDSVSIRLKNHFYIDSLLNIAETTHSECWFIVSDQCLKDLEQQLIERDIQGLQWEILATQDEVILLSDRLRNCVYQLQSEEKYYETALYSPAIGLFAHTKSKNVLAVSPACESSMAGVTSSVMVSDLNISLESKSEDKRDDTTYRVVKM